MEQREASDPKEGRARKLGRKFWFGPLGSEHIRQDKSADTQLDHTEPKIWKANTRISTVSKREVTTNRTPRVGATECPRREAQTTPESPRNTTQGSKTRQGSQTQALNTWDPARDSRPRRRSCITDRHRASDSWQGTAHTKSQDHGKNRGGRWRKRWWER